MPLKNKKTHKNDNIHKSKALKSEGRRKEQ